MFSRASTMIGKSKKRIWRLNVEAQMTCRDEHFSLPWTVNDTVIQASIQDPWDFNDSGCYNNKLEVKLGPRCWSSDIYLHLKPINFAIMAHVHNVVCWQQATLVTVWETQHLLYVESSFFSRVFLLYRTRIRTKFLYSAIVMIPTMIPEVRTELCSFLYSTTAIKFFIPIRLLK